MKSTSTGVGSDRVNIIESSLLNATSLVRAGVSTRQGGVSASPLGLNLSFTSNDLGENVLKNRELFFAALGIDPKSLAIPKQVHGNSVRRVDSAGHIGECDALVTDVPGVSLSVTVADCAPIFLLDPVLKVVGIIHAGWRGTVARIAEHTIRFMSDEYGSELGRILGYIGPCASVCCYSVGEDVASKFDSACVRNVDGKMFVDLKSANRDQLVRSGVPASQIEVSSFCTISDSELFHSFRRDSEASGRMMGVIALVG